MYTINARRRVAQVTIEGDKKTEAVEYVMTEEEYLRAQKTMDAMLPATIALSEKVDSAQQERDAAKAQLSTLVDALLALVKSLIK